MAISAAISPTARWMMVASVSSRITDDPRA
jgi:hypothetical protein